MQRITGGLAAIACVGALAWGADADAQLHIDAYQGYFLVGRFGEVCTTCEVTVLCERGSVLPAHGDIPEHGSFTVYHVQSRGFWSQMSTIWELLVAAVAEERLAARGHTRPLHVYEVNEGIWSAPDIVEARLQLEPGLLAFDGHEIDRVTQAWRVAGHEATIGYCQQLPLWDALEVIGARAAGAGAI